MKTRSLLPAAVAAFLVATTTDTLAYERGDVLLHLSFDDTVDAVGAVSGSTAILNGNVPAYTNEAVAPTIYWTAKDGSEQSRTNEKCLYAYNNRLQLKFSGATELVRPNLASATIEFFIKTVRANKNAAPVAFRHNPASLGTPPFPFMLQSDWQGGNYYLRTDSFEDASAAGSNASDRETVSKTVQDKPFADGTWHHVAATIAETESGKSLVKLFLDHVCVHSATTTKFAWNGLTDTMTIDFGDNGEYYIDEFRISKGALAASEFLRTSPLPSDGETIVHLSFDGTLDSLGPASGSTTLHSGSPAYSADVPAQGITWAGAGGIQNRHSNGKSLSVNNNRIQLKFPEAVALQRPNLKSATIEFFIKIASGNAGVVPLAFRHDPSNINTPPFPFLFQNLSATREIYLRVDCFNDASAAAVTSTDRELLSCSTGIPFADGQPKWHHVAVTVAETNNGMSLAKFYYDHRQVGSTVTSSKFAWNGLTDSMTIDFGSGGLQCLIDEFRITKGALEPAAFLEREPGATVMYMR